MCGARKPTFQIFACLRRGAAVSENSSSSGRPVASVTRALAIVTALDEAGKLAKLLRHGLNLPGVRARQQLWADAPRWREARSSGPTITIPRSGSPLLQISA